MKAIPGKIIIADKIEFVYYQLYKPDKRDLKYYHNSVIINGQLKLEYFKDLREYEASKQIIEVDNYAYRYVIKRKYPYIYSIKGHPGIKDNQPCTAEIVGESAIIISLSK